MVDKNVNVSPEINQVQQLLNTKSVLKLNLLDISDKFMTYKYISMTERMTIMPF